MSKQETLIRANEMKKLFYEQIQKMFKRRSELTETMLIAAFENAFMNVQPVNAEPIIFADWEWRGKQKGYFCSNCGNGCLLNYESDWHKSERCPHCGARMNREA